MYFMHLYIFALLCVLTEEVIADLKDFSNNFKVCQFSTFSVLLFHMWSMQ